MTCFLHSIADCIILVFCTGVRDEETRTPLHVASLRAHKNVVEYLVEEANCDVSE